MVSFYVLMLMKNNRQLSERKLQRYLCNSFGWYSGAARHQAHGKESITNEADFAWDGAIAISKG